ncbi:hypothetical protein MASR2M70_12010 [Bacillota bacterium]
MIRNKVISIVSGELSEHRELAERFKAELVLLPKGSLRSKVIRGTERFYHYIPSGVPGVPPTMKYIDKSNEYLLNELSRKKFIEESMEIIKSNIEILETFLEIYIPYDPSEIVEKLPKSYSGIDCSSTFGLLKTNNLAAWAKEPFKRNPLNPEGLSCKSGYGLPVRSKSESIIASQLETKNIPFRYEALLQLENQSFYPDFTILNPQDNKVIYWEHFGMVDDLVYANKMCNKLAEYRKHGIYEGDNLITTQETRTNPLSAHTVHKIIKSFLLTDDYCAN